MFWAAATSRICGLSGFSELVRACGFIPYSAPAPGDGALVQASLKHLISHELHLRVHAITHRLRVEKPPRMACTQADCIADQPTAVLNAIAADLDGKALYYQDFFIPESHLTLALDGFSSPR